MGLYVQQSGKHTGPGPDGKRQTFKVGDVVELTPEQAKAFGDKFKSVEVVEAEAAVLKAQQLAIAKAALAAEQNSPKNAEPAPAPAVPPAAPTPTPASPAGTAVK